MKIFLNSVLVLVGLWASIFGSAWVYNHINVWAGLFCYGITFVSLVTYTIYKFKQFKNEKKK